MQPKTIWQLFFCKIYLLYISLKPSKWSSWAFEYLEHHYIPTTVQRRLPKVRSAQWKDSQSVFRVARCLTVRDLALKSRRLRELRAGCEDSTLMRFEAMQLFIKITNVLLVSLLYTRSRQPYTWHVDPGWCKFAACFLRRDAVHSAGMLSQDVCLSHAGILSKQFNISSNFFHHNTGG